MEYINTRKIKYLQYANALLEKLFHVKKSTEPIDWKNAKEILVVDYNAIGDTVMLIPFLRTVRSNAPSARITLACRKLAKDVLENQDLVDSFITADRRWFASGRYLFNDFFSGIATIISARKTKFDIALEPRGDIRDIFLMHFCKALRKAAYTYTGGEYMLTDPVRPDSNIKHIIDDKIHFLGKLGCRVISEDYIPSLQLTITQIEDNKRFIEEHNLDGNIIFGIQPGAALDIKKWDGFAKLIKKLHEKYDDAKFLIFLSDDDCDLSENLKMELDEINECCIFVRENIRTYIQRIALCNLMICNDSSGGHIAAAFGIDVHVIFGPIMAESSKPYSKAKVFVYEAENVACRPCGTDICNNSNKCLKAISVQRVYDNIVANFR